jgi:hypothetical protein
MTCCKWDDAERTAHSRNESMVPRKYGIFMQDVAPCRTAKAAMDPRHSHNVEVLKWPGKSPGKCPVQNIWEEMKG